MEKKLKRKPLSSPVSVEATGIAIPLATLESIGCIAICNNCNTAILI